MVKGVIILLLLILLGGGGYIGSKYFFAAESEPLAEQAAAPAEEEKGWLASVIDSAVGMKDQVFGEDEAAKEPKAKAEKQETPKKESVKEKKKTEEMARREKETMAEDFIRQGNENIMSDAYAAADEMFKNALDFAQSDLIKYKAWRGRAMAAKMLGRGEEEVAAAKSMLVFVQNDGEMANAYEAMGNGYEKMQRYPEAVHAYQQGAALYQSSGNVDMAWSTFVACAKVMRRGLDDFIGSSRLLGRAWEIVDKSGMDERMKNDVKWTICLEYADNCRMAGDRQGQLLWNREAARYNPDWKANADIIEHDLKRQGLI